MSQEAGTPFHVILERCVLSADEALFLTIQILEKLTALHAGQAFHGDVCAKNLNLHPNGQIELMPLLAPASDATAAGDLYACGALLFEMMTGMSVGSKPAVPPRALQFPIDTLHWIPGPVRELVGKFCAPLVQNRFTSAQDAWNAVKALQIVSVNAADIGALAREIGNLTEVKLLLARESTKAISKRALAIAVAMQSRHSPGTNGLIVSHEIVAAALLKVRGEPLTVVPNEPVRKQPLIRSTPVQKEFPWMEIGVGVLVLAAVGFIFAPKMKISIFGKKEVPQAVAAKPVIQPMPDNASTSAKVLWLRQYEGPNLTWTNSVDGFDAFLHVSRNANFAMRVVDVTVRGNGYRVPKELEEGRYFWRLWDRATQKSVGPFEFTLNHLEPPKVLNPVNQQSLTISQTYTTVVLDVSWACKPSATEYEVVINDGEGAEFARRATDQCMLNSEQLPRGEYSLRVRVSQPTGEMNAWSEPVAFRVKGGSGGTLTKIHQDLHRKPAQAFKKSK